MNSNYIDILLDLVGSPIGVAGIVVGFILIYQAKQSPQGAWLLVSLLGFASSLAVFRDQYTPIPPPLVFPLQQLRGSGRPISIVLLALLLAVSFWKQNDLRQYSWRSLQLPTPLIFLIIVQGLIVFKTAAFGSLGFATLSALTFGGVVLAIRTGPSQWLQDNGNFYLAIRAIALVGVIFVVANAYQAAVDLYPITFVQGLLLGTTGNPQHAATLLASCVPCCLFLFEAQPRWGPPKAFWLVTLALIGVALFMTGSRTGSIMAFVSILLFYRHRSSKLLWLIVIVGVGLAVIGPSLNLDAIGIDFGSSVDKLSSGRNSRADVWAAMWRGFQNYPMFGVPLRGARLGYGENSWLATAASLGIVGLLPMVGFGVSCLRMLYRLEQFSARNTSYYFACSTVTAGVLSLLIGSIFEAFLLGNLTFALLALLLYLSLGQYLLDVQQAQSQHAAWPSSITDEEGYTVSPRISASEI